MKSLLNEQAQIHDRVKSLGSAGDHTNGHRPSGRLRDLGRDLAREFGEKEHVEHK
jgi:hypothetical protein